MAAALVLIDIQNDYFPGGKMELDKSFEASECARLLLNYFRETQRPIVHIQHVAIRPGATFFLPDTEGVKTHANVMPLEGEVVIQKHFPNSFRETRLLEHLRQKGIDQLVIAGMMTHMCVDATTRAATDFGFPCLIAADACATRTLTFGNQSVPAAQVHAAFLAALDGSYGRVLTVEEIIRRLQS
ncbi:MAG TPA: cysteine hydrolase family protein [Anaerolineae bacterium]